MKNRVLLITGVPGVGKTTIMRRVKGLLARERIRGFLTDEIRDERGERLGFQIETLDGKMECLSGAFTEAVARLLDAACPVIATVAQRGKGFIAEVKRHPRAETWEVTRANRDAMPGRIASWLDDERP